jgi:hypothetical protein
MVAPGNYWVEKYNKKRNSKMSNICWCTYPGIGAQGVVCNFELFTLGVLAVVVLDAPEIIHIVNPAIFGLICVGEPLVVGRSGREGELVFLAHVVDGDGVLGEK